MSQSVVDVCNSALQRLGAASIINITDNSREARACNLAFDGNRRAELRKYYWNFAMKRAVLAPDAMAPAYEFLYQFTLPSDCLRVQLPNDPYLDWKIEGRKILTNSITSPYGFGTVSSSSTPVSPTLRLRYVADITDCTQWDSAFYDSVSISLAMDICQQLTNSTTKKEALQQEYKDGISEARSSNAFETLPAEAAADHWWLVRN